MDPTDLTSLQLKDSNIRANQMAVENSDAVVNASTSNKLQVNVSAAYSYLSALARDQNGLPNEMGKAHATLQRHIAVLAGEPERADNANPAPIQKPMLDLIGKVLIRDVNIQEQVANSLTTRYQMVKTDEAIDTLKSYCDTLPKIFQESNQPGKALMRYLCEVVVNISTADNISPATARQLAQADIYAPDGELTSNGEIALGRLLDATIRFIQANQPDVLASLSRENSQVISPSTNRNQIAEYISEAVSEFADDSTYFDVFARNMAEDNDLVTEEITKRVKELIGRAATIARESNLISSANDNSVRAQQLSNEDAQITQDIADEQEEQQVLKHQKKESIAKLARDLNEKFAKLDAAKHANSASVSSQHSQSKESVENTVEQQKLPNSEFVSNKQHVQDVAQNTGLDAEPNVEKEVDTEVNNVKLDNKNNANATKVLEDTPELDIDLEIPKDLRVENQADNESLEDDNQSLVNKKYSSPASAVSVSSNRDKIFDESKVKPEFLNEAVAKNLAERILMPRGAQEQDLKNIDLDKEFENFKLPEAILGTATENKRSGLAPEAKQINEMLSKAASIAKNIDAPKESDKPTNIQIMSQKDIVSDWANALVEDFPELSQDIQNQAAIQNSENKVPVNTENNNQTLINTKLDAELDNNVDIDTQDTNNAPVQSKALDELSKLLAERSNNSNIPNSNELQEEPVSTKDNQTSVNYSKNVLDDVPNNVLENEGASKLDTDELVNDVNNASSKEIAKDIEKDSIKPTVDVVKTLEKSFVEEENPQHENKDVVEKASVAKQPQALNDLIKSFNQHMEDSRVKSQKSETFDLPQIEDEVPESQIKVQDKLLNIDTDIDKDAEVVDELEGVEQSAKPMQTSQVEQVYGPQDEVLFNDVKVSTESPELATQDTETLVSVTNSSPNITTDSSTEVLPDEAIQNIGVTNELTLSPNSDVDALEIESDVPQKVFFNNTNTLVNKVIEQELAPETVAPENKKIVNSDTSFNDAKFVDPSAISKDLDINELSISKDPFATSSENDLAEELAEITAKAEELRNEDVETFTDDLVRNRNLPADEQVGNQNINQEKAATNAQLDNTASKVEQIIKESLSPNNNVVEDDFVQSTEDELPGILSNKPNLTENEPEALDSNKIVSSVNAEDDTSSDTLSDDDMELSKQNLVNKANIVVGDLPNLGNFDETTDNTATTDDLLDSVDDNQQLNNQPFVSATDDNAENIDVTDDTQSIKNPLNNFNIDKINKLKSVLENSLQPNKVVNESVNLQEQVVNNVIDDVVDDIDTLKQNVNVNSISNVNASNSSEVPFEDNDLEVKPNQSFTEVLENVAKTEQTAQLNPKQTEQVFKTIDDVVFEDELNVPQRDISRDTEIAQNNNTLGSSTSSQPTSTQTNSTTDLDNVSNAKNDVSIPPKLNSLIEKAFGSQFGYTKEPEAIKTQINKDVELDNIDNDVDFENPIQLKSTWANNLTSQDIDNENNQNNQNKVFETEVVDDAYDNSSLKPAIKEANIKLNTLRNALDRNNENYNQSIQNVQGKEQTNKVSENPNSKETDDSLKVVTSNVSITNRRPQGKYQSVSSIDGNGNSQQNEKAKLNTTLSNEPKVSEKKISGLFNKLSGIFGKKELASDITNMFEDKAPEDKFTEQLKSIAHSTNAQRIQNKIDGANKALQSASGNMSSEELKNIPMDDMLRSLSKVVNDPNVSTEIKGMAKSIQEAITNPLGDLQAVSEWLGLVNAPITDTGSRAVAMQQWALMLLSIRFRQLGKNIDKFTQTEPFKNILSSLTSGDENWSKSALNHTLVQIERLQQMNRDPDFNNLPTYIPLPPSFENGREGGINVERNIADDGEMEWRLSFFFELPKLGPMQIRTSLKMPEVKLNIVTERLDALNRVKETSSYLTERLSGYGFKVAPVNVRIGTVYPPLNPGAILSNGKYGKNTSKDGLNVSI